MKYNFLKTSDQEVKNILIKRGFELVSESESVYIFLNDNTLTFNDIDKSKIQYSNILTF